MKIIIPTFWLLVASWHVTAQAIDVTINDSFCNHPLDWDITMVNVKQNIHEKFVEKNVPTSNLHDKGTDTIQTIEASHFRFAFLKTKARILFSGAEISKPGFRFSNKGVQIGITKEEFRKAMHISSDKPINEKFEISDSIGYCQCYFIFEGNTLKSVKILGALD